MSRVDNDAGEGLGPMEKSRVTRAVLMVGLEGSNQAYEVVLSWEVKGILIRLAEGVSEGRTLKLAEVPGMTINGEEEL